MKPRHCCLFVILIGAILCGRWRVVRGDEFDEQISGLAELRPSNDADLDHAEQIADQLLKNHTLPKEQAQIYFAIATAEGQAGLRRPAKVAEYAQKAFEGDLPIDQRMRASIYWGDALATQFPTERAKCVSPYIKGLALAISQGLPRVAPVPPQFPQYDVWSGLGDNDPAIIRIKAERAKAIEAWNEAKRIRKLVELRDTLVRQIKWLYGSDAGRNAELEQIVIRELNGSEAAKKLMQQIPEAAPDVPSSSQPSSVP
jgi:hypothetical protein